jgi:lipoate-protein ligase B
VVVYLLLNLRRSGLKVRELVCGMEEGIITTLALYGIRGFRVAGAPGVYVDQLKVSEDFENPKAGSVHTLSGKLKIASLGIKVSRGFSFHGLALNVSMDLEPFTRINPCGFPDLEVTDVLSQLDLIGSKYKLNEKNMKSCEHSLFNSDRSLKISEGVCRWGVSEYSAWLLHDVANKLSTSLQSHLTATP